MFGGTVKLNPLGLCVVVFVALLYLFLKWNSTSIRIENVSLKRLLIESIQAAEKGGVQVARIHKVSLLNTISKGLTTEGVKELVTDADLASHRAIRTSLMTAFKDYNLRLVSEERESNDGREEDRVDYNEVKHGVDNQLDLVEDEDLVSVNDVTVWIDPLDATQEFTENLLQYVTVLVCVAYKGEPIIGVVHRPFQHETFWAWIGKGQSKNINNAYNYKKSARNESSPLSIIVSRSHSGDVEKVASKAFTDKVKIIPAGGAGYKVLQVLNGTADVYVHTTLIKKWDICAGNALLNAVGGQMTTLDGEKIDYSDPNFFKNENGLVASITNHERFVEALKQLH